MTEEGRTLTPEQATEETVAIVTESVEKGCPVLTHYTYVSLGHRTCPSCGAVIDRIVQER